MLCVSYARDVNDQLQRNPFQRLFNSGGNNGVNPEDGDSIINVEDIDLRATLVSDNQSIANINGKMLLVGQSISGYELIEINIGKVLVRKDRKEEMIFVNNKYGSLR
ncbi:MAG: hypothetical protein AB8C40_00915 [Gammaproteobacteria bacterium]